MAYFSKFPKLRYSFDNGDTSKVAVDILQRVGFKQKTKDNGSLFADYHVKDGDTPEMVADALYGDSELHWVIMMFNDIVNPYTEWFQDNRVIEGISAKKYPGSGWFFVSSTGTNEIVDVDFARNQTVFGIEGNTFSSISDITRDNNRRSLVSKWDRHLSKLSVTGVTGSGTFTVGDYVTSYGVSGDGSTYGITALLKKIITYDYNSLNHFEGVTSGYALNPLGSAPVNGSQNNIMGGTSGLSAGGVSTGITFGATLLHDYVINGTNTYSVSNYEYEHAKNDKLKTIKVIRPERLQSVITEFEDLMQGR